MTIPALTRDQRYYLGKLIWRNIDGVAENVNRLMEAINSDPHSAVRVVGVHKWERAAEVLQALRDLVGKLEASASQATVEQAVAQLRDLAGVDDALRPHQGMLTEMG